MDTSSAWWRVVGVLAVSLLAIGAGCQFKGESPGGAGLVATEAVWEPEPVELRVYPATRFVREDGVPLLEARVEFLDAMGDTIKAVGQVRFELLAANPAGSTVGQQLYAWDVEMLSLEQQRAYYDDITRTYQFRLGLDAFEAAGRPTVLRVRFTPARDQERLETQAPIEVEAS